ncbi:hypothetical protein BDN72DRAFT_759499 [Pluteus cervinus]|uniref:Uncharacterized protein n=1 Tax=Pluteus cervinus TaxID=181527 RepID=A0ACD3B975_9AGAR|nr:hypothetical protein BDN72DRAFT_759499 [Pluteus cervinus]
MSSSFIRAFARTTRPLLHSTTTRSSTQCIRSRTSLYFASRSFSVTPNTRAALATSLPAKPTVVVSAPTQTAIDAEEIDVELIPPEQAKLVITDRAAEQLRDIATREHDSDAALRIAVESGGCHGYQYKMELAKGHAPDDYHFSHPTLKPSNILIDAVSLSMMNGSTVDYATELIGSSFRIAENPQAKGSGCGCGVSWELKE